MERVRSLISASNYEKIRGEFKRIRDKFAEKNNRELSRLILKCARLDQMTSKQEHEFLVEGFLIKHKNRCLCKIEMLQMKHLFQQLEGEKSVDKSRKPRAAT